MNYVLSKSNQEIFLHVLMNGLKSDESEMEDLVDGCKYYVHQIHGNTYFLSKSNETSLRKKAIPNTFISDVFDLADTNNFVLEEFSSDFVDYLMRNYSTPTNSIDQDIFIILQNYLDRYE